MSLLPKKVLLTGARGLIGKEIISPLLKSAYEVIALTSSQNSFEKNGVRYLKADLFNNLEIKNILNNEKPEYLIHMAWKTTGDYLTSKINYDYLNASMNLLENFAKAGGKRCVLAGTCGEYKIKNSPLKEDDDLEPLTLYAECKNNLNQKASVFCAENNISYAWGRIFYVYGHDESPLRLTGYILDALKNNQEVYIKKPLLIRDYMYTKDIAKGFVSLLSSKITGNVNICTGKGIMIKDLALAFASKMNKESLLNFGSMSATEPIDAIVGDNTRLKNEVGFIPEYTMLQAVEKIIKGEKNG